jgi:dipeptidase E
MERETARNEIDNGGVYIGVSAGSVVATNNLPHSLGYINCTLGVHMDAGTKSGSIDVAGNPRIDLTGENIILIRGDEYQVVG